MSRILIVEDEPAIASFITKGLRAQGYCTLAAGDGRTGLEKARSGLFDLVLLDLGLPDMDGTEVLDQLRAEGSTVPVVVLTARESVTERDGYHPNSDPSVHLAKPFRFAELLIEVRAQLGAATGTGTGS